MRVFLDTNVLASAFSSRGLCADLLRLIVLEHELVTGEVVLKELRHVLGKKFGLPGSAVERIDEFLREYHVESTPKQVPELGLSDRNDLRVVATAIAARAEFLVTGDKEMLALETRPAGLRIVSPREFWTVTSKKAGSA